MFVDGMKSNGKTYALSGGQDALSEVRETKSLSSANDFQFS